MKTAVFILFVVSGFSVCSQDPVRNAYKDNEDKADRDLVDKNVAAFMVGAAEGRLMNINESKLAVLKGSTSDIRNFGQSMIKSETALLNEIKRIAAARNITLPDGVSDKKREGQMELSEEAGKDFDERFLKMMKSGLEDDIKLFEKGNELDDPDVKEFVKTYLPIIRSHLDQLKTIGAD